MSFECKKHILLVLAVIMMLILIPASFAEDLNDASEVAIGETAQSEVVSAEVCENTTSGSDSVVAASDDAEVLEATTIVVDQGGSGDYDNLYDAINSFSSGQNYEVIVKEGTYTIPTYSAFPSVRSNITVVGEGNVVVSGKLSSGNSWWETDSGYTLSIKGLTFAIGANSYLLRCGGSSSLIIENCTFINCNASSSIIYALGFLNVTNSIFKNVKTTGTSESYGSTVHMYSTSNYDKPKYVNYCIFEDITTGTYTFSGYNPSSNGFIMNIDYNYFGSNDGPTAGTDYRNGYFNVNNYAIISSTTIDETVYSNQDYNLDIVQFSDNNGDELKGIMPYYSVDYESSLLGTSGTVTINNNVGIIEYNSPNTGSETITIKKDDTAIATTTFSVEADNDPTKIVVDITAADGDTNGNGSSGNPYQTLAFALTKVSDTANKVIIKPGRYTLSNSMINYNVDISSLKGNVIIETSTNHLTINDGVTVNLTNLVFTGATTTSIVSNGNLNITKCTFIDNAGDYVIDSTGKVDITASAFINNVVNNYIVKCSGGDVSNNFWGSNSVPNVNGVTYDNYAILNITINGVVNNEVYDNKNYDITVSLNNNDNTDLSVVIPAFDVELTADLGEVSLATLTVTNNIATATYNSSTKGEEEVKVKIGYTLLDNRSFTVVRNEEGWVYVSKTGDNDNDGSKYNPVADLSTALSKMGDGKVIIISNGTYTGSYSVSKSVNITADGEVNLTRGSSGTLFAVSGSHTINFNGITFRDNNGQVFSQSGMGGAISFINCTFINNKATNNIININYNNLTVTDCIFINNTASGSSYTTGGLIHINNGGSSYIINITRSIFVNNNMAYNYIIADYGNTPSVVADSNFWGFNNQSNVYDSEDFTSTHWIVVEAEMDTSQIVTGNTREINIKFKLTDGTTNSTLSWNVPTVALSISSVLNEIDDTVVMENNEGVVTYKAKSEGEETIKILSAENVLATFEFTILESEDGKIFVSVEGNDDTGDGSRDNPYKTITRALQDDYQDKIISLQSGNYNITNGQINKDVTVMGKDDTVVDLMGTALTVTGATLNLTNVKLTNGTSISCGDLTAYNVVFSNFTGVNVITSTGKTDISYSVFINNAATTVLSANNGNVSNNFWGSNNEPSITGATYDNYVIIDLTLGDLVDGEVSAMKNHDVTLVYKSNDNIALKDKLPEITVNLVADNGTVADTTLTVSNTAVTTTYGSDEEVSDKIAIKSGDAVIGNFEFKVTESEEGKIFVDASYTGATSDGSKARPYKTITAGINAASSGNLVIIMAGNYTITSKTSISYNMNITARGEVIVTSSLSTNLFDISASKTVTFSGITFKDLYSTDKSGVFYLNTGSRDILTTLIVDHCNFINITGPCAISRSNDYTFVNIIYSTFINNTVTGTNTYYGLFGMDTASKDFKLIFNYNVLVNNNIKSSYFGTGNYIVKYNPSIAYNFWGSNEKPSEFSNTVYNTDTIFPNWVIINSTNPEGKIYAGNTYELNLEFILTTGSANSSLEDIIMPTVTLPVEYSLNSVNNVVIGDNKGKIEYIAVKDGSETVNVLAPATVATFIFTVEENPDGKIFVSKDGDDINGNGSSEKPYATIARALQDDYDGKVISVQSGTFELANCEIKNDMTIKGKDDTIIDLMGTELKVTNGATLNLNSVALINGTAIICGDLTAEKVLFLGFTGTNVITSTGNVDISYSAFVNNAATNIVNANNGNVSNNFWGSNEAPSVNTGLTLENYVIIVSYISDISDNELSAVANHDVTVEFKSSDNSTLAKSLPNVDVSVNAVNGTISNSTVTVSENIGTTAYSYGIEGSTDEVNVKVNDNTIAVIAFTMIEDQTHRLYVSDSTGNDNNDGSLKNPYKTITEALKHIDETKYEIIVLEGTYSITGYYTISADVIMTGRGEVNLTTSSSSYLFYMRGISSKGYSLTLNNLIIRNVPCTSGNVIYSYGYGNTVKNNLVINNCSFINCVGSNGLIYTYQTEWLNITDSNFIGSSSSYQFVRTMYNTVNINIFNNNFINNTGSAIIYVYATTAKINYNNFIDNHHTNDIIQVQSSSGTVNIDYNFWGSNDKPSNAQGTLNHWVILNTTNDNNNIYAGRTYNLGLEFIATTGSVNSTLSQYMPDITFPVTYIVNRVDNITVAKNKANISYNALKEGNEIINILAGDNTVVAFMFAVEENPDGKIFVSKDGDDSEGDGSDKKPYATIARTLQDDYEGKIISVQSGTFELAGAVIDKEVTIKGRDDTVIDLMGTTLTSTVALTLNNVILTNGTGINCEDLTAEKVLFTEFSGANLITSTGNVDISYSVFMNNDVTGNIIEASSGNVSNNFWGSNNAPTVISSDLILENYVILVSNIPDITNDTLGTIEKHNITLEFRSNDNKTLAKNLPDVNVSVSAVNGTVDNSIVTISENNGVTTYSSDAEGSTDEVTVKIYEYVIPTISFTLIEDETGRLYVDNSFMGTSTGSKAQPFKNIKDALAENVRLGGGYEIIVLEGTGLYSITDYYTISANVTITGRGDVHLTTTSNLHLFFNKATSSTECYSLTLNNLIIENCICTSSSYNNNYGYGGVIYSWGQYIYSGGAQYYYVPALIINNCTFVNNTGRYGMIYATYTNLVNITNCNFINNTGAYYGMVVTATGTSYLNILHNNFVNNNCTSISSYGRLLYLTSSTNGYVNYNNFINNVLYATTNIIYKSSGTLNADYNFFGSNDNPSSKVSVSLDNWIVTDLSIDSNDISIGDETTFNIVFKYTKDGTTFISLEDKVMPTVDFNLLSALGNNFTSNTVTMINNTANTTYNATRGGIETISINYNNTQLNNLTFEIRRDIVTISVEDIELYYNEDKVLEAVITLNTSQVTGINVTVKVDGEEFENLTTDSEGKISFNLPELEAGKHIITLIVDDYTYFGEAEVNATVKKAPTKTDIDLISEIILINKNTTVNVHVNATEGTVTFYINDIENETVEIDSEGNANLTLTFTETNIYNITANFTSKNYANSSNKTVLTVKIPTNITVNETELYVEIGTTLDVNATLNPQEAGSLTYESGDESIATIDSNGIITPVSKGTTTIIISYAGNDTYNESSITITVNIGLKKSQINISAENTNVTKNATIKVNITTGATGTVNITITDVEGNIIKSENVTLAQAREYNFTTTAIGKYNVTVIYYGDDNYVSSQNETSFEVNLLETVIDVDETLNVNVGETGKISPTVTPNNVPVSFQSNDDSIATVDSEGVVTGNAQGTVNITVTIGDGITYAVKTVNVTVNVTKITTIITVTNDTLTLNVEDDSTIEAGINPAEAGNSFTYESNNISVATVSEDGVITAVSEGTAVITVKYAGSGVYLESNATVTVTVSRITPEITVTTENVNVTQNATVKVTLPDDATDLVNITVKDNEGNIVFSENVSVESAKEYNITMNTIGNYTVTVNYYGNIKYSSNENETKLNVTLLETTIEVNKTLSVNVTENNTILPTVTPANVPITFTSNDDSIATVDSEGVVTGNAQGTVNITVTIGDGITYAVKTVNVTVNVTKIATAVTVSNSTLSLNVDDTSNIEAIIDPAEAGNTFTYESNDPSVATVSEDGVITAVSEGIAVITVKYEENNVYLESNTTITVTVSRITPEITVTAGNVNVTQNATVKVTLPDGATGLVNITVKDNEGNIVFSENVSVESAKEYNITMNTIGNYTVTATYAGNIKYNSNENKSELNVTLLETTLSVNETLNVTVNDEITIEPAVNPGEVQIKFESNDTSIATVNDEGTVTGIIGGVVNITVTIGDGVIYAVKTANVTVTVNKIATDITVNESIIFTEIGEKTQINATLNPAEAGSFTYTSSDENIVAVDENGIVTAVKKGSVTITVSYAESDKYLSSSEVITVNVELIESVITVDVEDTNITKNATVKVTLTEGAAGNINITVINSENSIVFTENVTVDDAGEYNITMSAVGEYTVKVIYYGDENYAPSENENTFTVYLLETELSISETLNINVTETNTIVPNVTPEGIPISFKTTDESIATVNDEGIVTGVAQGLVNITVTVGDGVTYAVKTSNVTVNVTKIAIAVTVSNSTVSLNVEDTSNIEADISPSEATKNFTYESDNPSIANVSADGVITAVSEGTAVITVKYAENNVYLESNATITVTVSRITPEITVTTENVNVTQNATVKVTLPSDATGLVNITVKDINGDIIHTENVSVGSAKEYNVLMNTIGNYTVTATYSGNIKYSSNENETKLNVTLLETTLTVNPTLDVDVSRNVTIVPVFTPGEAPVSFVSNDTSIATVDNNGIVVGSKVGVVTVTVTVGDAVTYAVKTANVTVTVNLIDTTLSVDETLDVDINGNITISPEFSPSEVPVTYVSNDTSIVTVDNGGVVVGSKGGVATVTVTIGDNITYVQKSANITITVHLIETTIDVNSTMDVYVGKNNTIVPVFTPGEAPVSYISNNSSVVTVDGNGVVSGIAKGTATVTVTIGDGVTYAVKTANVTVTVNLIDTNLDVNSTLNVYIGANNTIGAEFSPVEAPINYVSNNTSIATVDSNGVVTGISNGTAIVSVTVGDNKTYVQKTVNITVNVAYPPYDGIIYVSKDGSDNNDGSITSLVLSISRAIELATNENNKEHKIIIAEGTYTEHDLTISSDLDITADGNVIIDANSEGRIFEITAGTVSIDGITFINANVTGYGGAVNIKDAQVLINNSVFINNTASSGAGAVLMDGDNGVIANSVFENNSARNGGAVMVGSLSFTPNGENSVIINCTFNNNNNIYSYAGSTALAVYADSVTVKDTNFTNNHGEVGSNHGALYIYGENAEVYGCLFENNSMSEAGALQADGDYVDIHDNKFINNIILSGAGTRGGAVEIQSPNAVINNNIFINNGGDDCAVGGAIVIVYVDYGGEITISNNNFTLNTASSGGAIYVDGDFNTFDITVENNIFDGDSDGIYLSYVDSSTISDNTFKNLEGYAIYVDSSTTELSGNTMTDCEYEIYNEYGTVNGDLILTFIKDSTIKIGEVITLNATLTDDMGNSISGGEITFTDIGSYELVNGIASAEFSSDTSGTFTVTGEYDSTYSDITVNNATITVEKLNANIKAGIEDDSIVITLLDDATGNLTVTIAGKTYSVDVKNGSAKLAIPDLAPGDYAAEVSLTDDDRYSDATATVTFNIPRVESTVRVNVNDIKAGETPIIMIILPNDATGNITLTLNGKNTNVILSKGNTLVLGSMLIVTLLGDSNLAVGSYPVSVTYNGDSYYLPSNGNTTFTVTKSDLSLSANSDDVIAGDDVVITVTGLAEATGNITITVNGKTYQSIINNSAATLTVKGLAEGNYTVTVNYAGDNKYNAATTSASFKVGKISDYNMTVNTNLSSIRNGTVSVELPDNATGNVTVSIGDKTYAAELINGSAVVNIPVLDGGNYAVKTTYSGDTRYDGNSDTKNITVPDEIIINAPELVKYFSSKDRFTLNLTDSKHNVLANKTVSITINGNTYNRTTDAQGIAGMNINLNSGEYDVTVSFAGDNVYPSEVVTSKVTVKSTVNGSDITKLYRNGTQYYATFLDSAGNYLANGTLISFNINGVVYERRVNGFEGQARLNINLAPGTYTITAINTLTGENTANNITVLPVIVDNNDLVKYYRNASRFTAKIINGDGTPMTAGLAVNFNINGVVYTRYTTGAGNVGININLQPGDYVITTEYNGCKVSNTIKVLPVLSAVDLTKKFGVAGPFVATLVDGQGNPLANTNITFNINGVFYNRLTNATGQAKLNINLQAGEYIITSSYNGSSISNKVTVTA